jgi:hypothetical protein
MQSKVPVNKRRASSLKGWRTRKRMKEARQEEPHEQEVHELRHPAYMRRALPNPWLEMK